MTRILHLAALLATLALDGAALAAGPLAITTRLLVEQRVAAADGTTRVKLVPAARAVPGDRVQVVLAYRNTGAQALGDLVLANPVPKGMAFRSIGTGPGVAEVSADGRQFGALAALRVATPAGGTRPATIADITQVRWRLTSPLPAGAGGEATFQAVLR